MLISIKVQVQKALQMLKSLKINNYHFVNSTSDIDQKEDTYIT